ncbi:membrane-associated phospholipid phosphatase [Actinoplanes campanulatus]|uniref:Membrane-associated phospholipid phosphatase n=1 Tax=Actinoplanes campanulatus TaxID=113559 RepID=A0A7W5FG21_9ACTN|nr:phosphatase PAP2 family protein [Actinoplanes campanulatus]MBB3096970.1 membrane-associated phospholipid phosphatase [Actinoplanes campanulatus]GGN14782.1 phosphatidic acid phosphatase [Actinoplanes campanulatus]GID37847.1 phosphatidic acid phosphatase [Actinoplanes campanulatus]
MSEKIGKTWWPEVAALVAFAALTLALVRGHLLDLDQWVADWAFAHQPAPVYWTARVFNYLGQGGQVLMPVTLILTGVLFWRTRSVRALLPFVVTFALTYCTIGPAKIFFDRAAPRFTGPDAVMLFNPSAAGDKAMSYPSGHVANTLVWFGVIALLLTVLMKRDLSRREWLLLRVAPVVIVFVTTVYTGFHWLTDSIAALFLGFVLVRLLGRIPWGLRSDPGAGAHHPARRQVGGEDHQVGA